MDNQQLKIQGIDYVVCPYCGAEVILNSELNGDNLSEKLNRLTSNINVLKEMGKKINSLEIKNVEDKIYNEIKNVIRK